MPIFDDNFIVHLSTEMPMGGGERQILYLYKGLAEKNIPQIIICALGSKLEAYCQQHHYRYISLKRRGGFSLLYAWELKKIFQDILKTEKIPVIHCHDAHAHTHAMLADLLSLHHYSLRLIIHKKVVPSHRKKGLTGLNKLKYRYPGIRKIICVSQAAADVVKEWAKQEKIIVLHDTLDLRDYISPKPHIHFTIGIIGSLIPVKNHALFLDCAKKVLTLHPSIQFWIIGDGSLRKILKEQAADISCQQIKFLGFRENIPDLLSQLDILMVTSKNEGLCSTILQAMAAQVPVIAKNVGGIPELIQHNYNGLLAENQEDFVRHILSLYENSELRQQLAKTALLSVKEYDLPIYTEKMLNLYKFSLSDSKKTGFKVFSM